MSRPYQFLFLLFFFTFTCTALAQDAPPSPVSDAPVNDATLGPRITRILASIPAFENVEVQVSEGVVVLTGSVISAAQRSEAEELVSGLEGVVYVVNNVAIEGDVNEALDPAFSRLRTYLTNFTALLPLLGIALVILAVFWFVSGWVSRWTWLYQRLHVNPLLREFLRQIIRAAIFLVGLVLALDIIGATPFVTAVLGTAGVAGLAVGFAFRDIIENYLAGILMSARQPFAQNDFVRIGTNEGNVVRLTARELVLMTPDGNQVRIPNATVFKSELYNFSRNPLRRFDFVIGVALDEDLSEAQRLGLATLQGMKGVLTDPAPFSAVNAIGEVSVQVQFFAWINTRDTDFLKAKSQAIRLVKETFEAADIRVPEAVRVVRMQRDKPSLKEPRARPVTREAKQVDVSPNRQLDKQLEEECSRQDEENLLNPVR